MEKVRLKEARRIKNGHLWIFSNELSQSPKAFEPGSLVEIYDRMGRFLGIGYINPNSLISIRLLTRKREKIDGEFFRQRIKEAIEFRKGFLPSLSLARLIYSEADFLPGLIVDKYNNSLSIQILTMGMERFSDLVFEILDELLRPDSIVLRNDSPSRILEGLPLEKKVIKGEKGKREMVKEGEVFFEIDLLEGQKTGFFLDQRENRIAFRDYIDGGEGLDLFCYSGGFGLHLAKKGAKVKGVDESGLAIELGKRSLEFNGLEDRYEFIKADVFEFLRKAEEDGKRFDFIVLDPPSFAKSRKEKKDAMRGYKEINRIAIKLLKKGGLLCTSSCSYHISLEEFIDILSEALRDAKREARILEIRFQSRDHPILPQVPETRYLKSLFLRIS